MDVLYTWIRNIVIYMILNTIIMNLLGNSSYKKYVSIVSGMILVLIVVSPFIKYLRMEGSLDYYLKSNEFAVETADFKNNLLRMEDQQMNAVFEEYTNRIKNQVELILAGEELKLIRFNVIYNKDTNSIGFGEITRMEIEAGYDNQEVKQESRIEVKRVEIGSIVGEAGNGMDMETSINTPSPTEINIKIKLSDFYNIEPDNINISVQGG